jgi:hypothetical protein
MPLDPKEFEKVFAKHFETIEPEQFLDNLKAACPYLFAEDSIATTDVTDSEDRSLNAVVSDIKKVKASQ